jgi:CBS domain-containing protein
MMTSGQICSRDVVAATRDTTVQEAARLMRRHHVGTVVVVEKQNGVSRPVGIVTDRDIVVEVNAVDLDPHALTVGDIMSSELASVNEEDGLMSALEVMRLKGVRRLPVTDMRGELVGIVSIDDLLEPLTRQVTELARIVGRERQREIESRH